MYASIYNGIIFVEGNIPCEKELGYLSYGKESITNTQLKSLDDVKLQLSQKAKQMGANAIINFEYGQKSMSWFKSLLLSFDDNIDWYGKGIAVVLNDNDYNFIVNRIRGWTLL